MWMEIVCDDDSLLIEIVHLDQIANGHCERVECRELFEIPDMLAHEGLAVDTHGDRVLEIGTDGQDRTGRWQGCDAARGVATTAAKDYRAELVDSSDRIIDAACNRPVA